MNERERAVNQALQALDEAHRLGRITRADYRARRRALLGSLCDSDGVTARNAVVPAAAATMPSSPVQMGHPLQPDVIATLFPERRALAWKMLVFAAGLGMLGLALYLMLHSGTA